MASSGGGTGRRRRRRSSAEIAKLEALRQAHVARQAAVRDNERRVEEALGPFAEAAAAVEAAHERLAEQHATADERLAHRLEELDDARAAALAESESARETARNALAAEVERWRAAMGASVRTIRAAGVDVASTTALLGISARDVHALARLRAAGSGEKVASSGTTGGDAENVAEEAAGMAAEDDGLGSGVPGQVGAGGPGAGQQV
jgi:DNA repair exonuclease SbcCD ATPase subunit